MALQIEGMWKTFETHIQNAEFKIDLPDAQVAFVANNAFFLSVYGEVSWPISFGCRPC